MTKRRDFIKKSLIGTAGIAIGGLGFSARSYGSVIGSNDRITMAVIGLRGRGRGLIERWCELKDNRNVFVKTICDADEAFFPRASKMVQDGCGTTPVTEWDMRKVFDDKDIDAVSFATPNHWHALGTIWACQAGKHVFVEKPASHNIFEGRKMVDAARKYNRIVQVGHQNRSIDNVKRAIKLIHDGGIGDVYMAKALNFKPRNSFGIAPDSAPPKSLHYDMWLGPAPYRPYNEKRVHYNWHWHWDTGGGDIGNQGPHQLDIARWGMNVKGHPVSIYSTGGIYGWSPQECSQETPDTQAALFTYEDGRMIVFEQRGRHTHGESSLDIKIGTMFYGSEGYLELNDRHPEFGNSWRAFRNGETEPFAESKEEDAAPFDPSFLEPPGGIEHFANFLDAVRSGNYHDLTCDIYEGHIASSLTILANISYKLKRQLTFVGRTETFANDQEANMMLKRNYREPYIVPDIV